MPQTLKHADVDFLRDTSPEALKMFLCLQRRRTGEQKLADAFDLSEGPSEMAKQGARMRYPAAPEREVFLRAVATRLPRELMIRAYGWDPLAH